MLDWGPLEDRTLLTVTLSGIPDYVTQGPGPIANGQSSVINSGVGGAEVEGAIDAIAVDPSNSIVGLVGSVNGGIWKTTNLMAVFNNGGVNHTGHDEWTPLTDQYPSLSINSLAYVPPTSNNVFVGEGTNGQLLGPGSIDIAFGGLPDGDFENIVPDGGQVVYAGIGGNSSFNSDGGGLTGILKTTDGGNTWQDVANQPFSKTVGPDGKTMVAGGLAGADVRKIVPLPIELNPSGTLNSSLVLAATDQGVFLSQDGGQTWTDESDRPGSGLPSGASSDLVLAQSITGNGDVLYAAVPDQGVFRTTVATITSAGGFMNPVQLPLTWTAVNSGLSGVTTPYANPTNVSKTGRIDLAVHDGYDGDEVYAALVQPIPGQGGNYFYGVFRSVDQGTTWQSMGVPSDEDGMVDPEGQMNQQGAIVADPNVSDVLYIGGDAKFGTYSIANIQNPPDGNLFVGLYNGGQPFWQSLTGYHPGDPVSGKPHADTRTLVFASDYLFDGCDGGIYAMFIPSNAAFVTNPTGTLAGAAWASLNGNMFTNEIFSVAYDYDNQVLLAGSQDNGTNVQTGPGQLQWSELDSGSGDGGFVAAKYAAGHMRYWYEADFSSNAQFLQYTNIPFNLVADSQPWTVNGQTLKAFDASGPNQGLPFQAPFQADRVGDNVRLVLATNNFLYESFDSGATATVIGNANSVQGQNTVLVYGGTSGGQQDPDLVIDGAGTTLWLRTQPNTAVAQVANYPGKFIRAIDTNPNNWKKVTIVDTNASVWQTPDITASPPIWNNLTFNLPLLTSSPGAAGTAGALAVITGSDGLPHLLVGGGQPGSSPLASSGGIYELDTINGRSVWLKFGANLPNALVTSFDYVALDNLLAVGTLGRGAFTVPNIGNLVAQLPVVQVTSDNDPSNPNDNFTLVADPNNPLVLDISDNGDLEQTIPITAIGEISVTGGAGTDTLTLDFRNGVFNPPGGITFNGGGGPGSTGDSLIVYVNNPASSATFYTPFGPPGTGTIVSDGVQVSFSNLAPVFANNAQTFTLITPLSGNLLTLDTPGLGQFRISGSSGGTAFENATVGTTAHVVLNLAQFDVASEADTVLATAAALLAVPNTDFTLQDGIDTANNVLFLDAQGHDVTITQTTIAISGAKPLSFSNLGTINLNNAGIVTVYGISGQDQLVVNATGAAAGNMALNGGTEIIFNTLKALDFLELSGGGALTVHEPAGTVFAPADGVAFDNADSHGTLTIDGGGGAAFSESDTAGPADHAGNIVFSGPVGGTYTFLGVQEVTDRVPVGNYTVNGTVGPNLVQLVDSPFGTTSAGTDDFVITDHDPIAGTGFVDDFPDILFSQKTNLVLDGGVIATAQGDLLEVNYRKPATGLSAVSVHGAGGNDTIRVLNSPLPVATTLYADGGNALIAVRSDLALPLTIYGGAGNDTVYGGAGADSTVGGTGTSVLRAQGGNAYIASNGNDVVYTGNGQVTVHGGAGSETVYGGAGNDLIDGDRGPNVIHTGDGNTLVNGGPGGNLVLAGAGNDTIYGGAGNDTIYGGAGQDSINGVGGYDSLHAGTGRDTIEAGTGDSAIFGGVGANLLDGGSGNCTITAGSGPETLAAGNGDNDFVGGPHTASMTVGNGTNALIAGSGTGGTIQAGAGQDVIVGPAGGGATIATAGSSRIWGQGGKNTITGGAGADTIDAGAGGNNVINGNGGADLLIGRSASDVLQGSSTSLVYPSSTTPNPVPTYASVTSGLPSAATLPTGVDYRGRWTEMASSASGAGLSGLAGFSSEPTIAADSTAQYVAWTDQRTGGDAIYVAEHTTAGGSRELAGSAHGAGISAGPGDAHSPSIALDVAGNPFVAWVQDIAGRSDVQVAYYEPSANGGQGGWTALGSSLSPGGISQDGQAADPQAVETSNGPVVAWLDSSSGAANVYVEQFTTSGGAWIALGLGSASGTGVSGSSGGVRDLALATDGNHVAAAWTVAVGGTNQVYLREYQGISWQGLDGSDSGGGLSAAATDSGSPTIAFFKGNLFAAWQDDSSNYWEIEAERYDGTGWYLAGSTGTAGAQVSTTQGSATQPKLAADNLELELVWADDRIQNLTGNTIALYARQWDGTEFAEEQPGDASGTGISDTGGDPQSLALALDGSGHPFVTWSEDTGNGPQIYVRGDTFRANVFVGTTYYVNGPSTQGDEICTAPGAAGNTGRSPAQPLPSIQDVLDDYTLQPGDVIVVDHDTYAGGFYVPNGESGFLVLGVPGQVATIQGSVDLSHSNSVTLQALNLAGAIVTTTASANLTLVDDTLGSLVLDTSTSAQVIHNAIVGPGLVIAGAPVNASIEHNTISGSATGVDLTGLGVMGLELRDNRISGGTTGIELAAAAQGDIADNDVTAGATGLSIDAPFTGGIETNTIHGGSVGVAYNASAPLSNNAIENNATGVASNVADSTNGFGFVGATLPNQIFQNGAGVDLIGGTMQGQHVYDNTVGVNGTGTLVSSSLHNANVIEQNGIGVYLTGPIEFNRIDNNATGIQARSGQLVANDLIYRNASAGLSVVGQSDVRVIQDTFYTTTGDLLSVLGASSNVQVLDSIFWNTSGYDLDIANDSQAGFFSDYNDLNATSPGKLVHWDVDFTDILDWQDDLAQFDLHSIGTTVVNPLWAQPRFYAAAQDDYRILPQAVAQRFSSPTVAAADPIIDLAQPGADTNLLADPGFEQGLAGWSTNPTAAVQTAGPAPYEGSQYFAPGGTQVGFAQQTVDLVAAGFSASQLDSQTYYAVFSGRVRVTATNPVAQGLITLTFLDVNQKVIGTDTVHATNVSDRWELVGDRTELHVGTRFLTYRFEADRQTGTIDGAFLDNAFVRLEPDTEAVDQGAYGNSAVQGALGPPAHPIASPQIALRYPDLYTDWEENTPHAILWNTYENTTLAPVRIDLFQDGPNGTTFLANIATSVPDTGQYFWIPSHSGIGYGTHGLRIQLSLVGNPTVTDRSTEPFAVPENTTTFYVASSTSTTNDDPTIGTALGSNRNTGRTASQPKPLPNNILRTYILVPGDMLYVNTGDYALFAPVAVSGLAGTGGSAGFGFTGPADPARVAMMSLANPLTMVPVLQLDDASFTTLAHLTLAGSQMGLWAHDNSTNLTLSYLTANGMSSDGFDIEAGSNLATLSHLTATNNAGIGIDVKAPILDLDHSFASGNALSGIVLSNPGTPNVVANEASFNGGYGIEAINGTTTPLIVGSTSLSANGSAATEGGNLVHDNVAGGIDADGDVQVAGNTVYNQSRPGAAGILLADGASAQDNVVHDNDTGILSVGAASVIGNRVYHNTQQGIRVASNSTIEQNVVYSNAIGVEGDSLGNAGPATVMNNLIYANSSAGLLIHHGSNSVDVLENTIDQPAGDAIHALSSTSNLHVRDNILMTQGGAALDIATDSELGFASDYNDIDATSSPPNLLNGGTTGTFGTWEGLPVATLSAWQSTTLQDRDSLALDPLFVAPAGTDGILGYGGPSSDGRDDDFHPQSLQGSFHGGSLAPVTSPVTDLPVLPTATLTVDTAESPTIDRGSPNDPDTNEPAPNGGFVNLGNYGDTAQASLSASSYLVLLKPDGGEVWPEGQTFPVLWRTQDQGSGGSSSTVTIALLQQPSGGAVSTVLTIATAAPNSGEYDWMVPSALTPAADYLVQVTRNDNGKPSDTSRLPFTISTANHIYYVNDATVQTGDWTTAPGNDANDGLTPATPKATIQAVLAAYHLGMGDVIEVDEGTYTLTTNVAIAAASSGVTIEGYNSPAFPTRHAVLNRASSANGADVFDLSGGTNVTLEDMVITGGQVGINALSGAASTGLNVTNCEITANSTYGIELQATNVNAVITGNNIHDNTGSAGVYITSAAGAQVTNNRLGNNGGYNIQGNGATNALIENNDSNGAIYGIYFGGTGATVQNNTVHNATSTDIQSTAPIVGNTAWNAPIGISSTGTTVSGNTVFLDGSGIVDGGGSTIANNRAFDNTNDGINAVYDTTITGNHAYNNGVGIHGLGAANTTAGPFVTNNLVDGNTKYGILFDGGASPTLLNNTVNQPTGTAVRIEGFLANIQVENNILWAQNGYDVSVDPASETGFASDYNDLFTTGAGIVGQWEGHDLTALADWSYQLGVDAHSIAANPQFVNPAGPDGVEGFSTQPSAPAQIVDDSSGAGFTATGSFTQVTGMGGFDSTYEVSGGAGAVGQASWVFSGLTPDRFYQIALTWPQVKGATTRAAYTVQDGTNSSIAFTVDESQVPADFTDTGAPWKSLGTFYETTGTLTVSLSHTTDPNLAVADAVRLQPIVGDAGGDDDFQLQAGSPAVAAGDPASTYIHEPSPNGERIDMGRYGNTPQATAAALQMVSVIAPTALSKVQAGRSATVSWLVSGVTPASYEPGLILANTPVSYYRLGDAPGSTTAADSSGNAHTAAYQGGVTLGITPRRGTDGTTAALLDGTSGYVALPPTGLATFTSGFSVELWVYPTTVGNNQPFLDLGNGPASDNIVFSRFGTSTGLVFQVYNGSNGGGEVYVSSNAIQQNVWQEFAATVTSTGLATVYKNGAVLGSAQVNVPLNVARSDDYIGRSNWSTNAYFGGAIADVAIYNQALTAAQIQAHLVVFGTSEIDLLPNGNVSQAVPIATAAPNGQPFTWQVPPNLAPGMYQIRVASNDGNHPQGLSAGLFQVAQDGHDFYVNASTTSGGVFTTAPGNNQNSGKSPAQPMASLQALLAEYSPGAGDTVYVDSGTYVEDSNVVLTASDSGVTIEGPSTAVALLNRNNTASGTAALQFAGASNVLIENLSFTGGDYGIEAYDQGGQNLTISNCAVYGNLSDGIEIFGYSVSGVTITNDVVHDNPSATGDGTGIDVHYGTNDQIVGSTIYNNGWDITFGSANGLVSNNTIYNAVNSLTATNTPKGNGTVVSGNTVHDVGGGIIATNVLVENNTVARAGPFGINATGATVQGNSVQGSATGILGVNSVVDDNTIVGNTVTGLAANGGVTAQGNTITGNALGVAASTVSNDFDHNLIAGNATGVEINAGVGTDFLNNTVVQTTGDALDLVGNGQGITLENNILESAGGYVLRIGAASEPGLVSDYNDLFATGSATFGQWEGADLLTSSAWFYATGLDQHSISADPLFVNPAAGNYQLQAGSPAIAAGDPLTPYNGEPAPNSERVDLGCYGGTAMAAASPAQNLQILDPTATTKLQPGRVATVSWLTSGLALGSAYDSTILSDAPIDFYRLNESTGATVAADSSGNGNNATYQGGITFGQTARRDNEQNTVVQLDGTSGYVALPSTGFANLTGGFTAEAWVYPTSVVFGESLFNFGNGNSDDIVLSRSGSSNDLVFQVSSNSMKVVAPNTLQPNQWQFFAVTIDVQGNAVIYRNGLPVASGPVGIPRNVARTNDYVGKSNPGYSNYAGLVGDFAVYGRALTPARILAHAAAFGTSTVSLLPNGSSNAAILLAQAAPNNLPFTFTVPANLSGGTYTLQVAENVATAGPPAVSAPFVVGQPGHDFYINDNVVNAGDLTTAPGNDNASGTTPADPMASLPALLQAYTLGSGDVIHIDAGSYTLTRSIVLGPSYSGVAFEGPATALAAIDRNLAINADTDFELEGAKNVTIENLSLTGAVNGIQADENTNSDGLTIENDVVYAEAANGIEIDEGNANVRILDNTVRNNPTANQSGISVAGDNALVQGNLVFGNFYGIYASYGLSQSAKDPIVVGNNTVHDNALDGIVAGDLSVVTNNTVFNQANTSSGTSAGIFERGGTVEDNTLYNNGDGIWGAGNGSGPPIQGNRVYDNSVAGIASADGTPVIGNYVYSNTVGIQTAGGFAVIEDNLVYANTNDGLIVNGSTDGRQLFSNNTIVQNVGDAVLIENSSIVRLRNTILEVQAGYDLYVAANGQSGLNSNNNLFALGTSSSANIGYWGGSVTTLSAWQAASGGDASSVTGDPRFLDPAGADNVLGYTSANGGYDGGKDDNFALAAGSPAIDHGDSWLAPVTDITGSPHHDDPGTPNQGSPDYFESDTGSSQFAVTGTSLGLHGQDDATANEGGVAYVALPFAFPFYGHTYTNLYVGVDGLLTFGNTLIDDGANSDSRLLGVTAVTPFWSDLSTTGTGNDVFVTSSSTQVMFRWNATNKSDGTTVNFAATLFSNGQIRFDYGPMTSTHLTPTIGLSAGNGQLAKFSMDDGRAALGGADSVLWSLQPGYVDIGAYEYEGSSTDTTRPTITAVVPTQVASGGMTNNSLNQITLTFSKLVNTIDVLAPANYQLLYAGPDGVFGTSDDVIYALDPQSYDAATDSVTLAPAVGGDALPAGLYQLTVYSSGGHTIHDVSGNALDGGSGGDYVRTFTLKPEVKILQFATNGTGTATIQYEAIHTGGVPFGIGLYRSTNAVFDATATLLQTIALTSRADLSGGVHTNTYTLGSLAGQLALPGTAASGPGAELATDYNLLLVADPSNSLGEITPADGSNVALYLGVYTAGGVVYVHGTPGNDVITVAPSGPNVVVTLDGAAFTFATDVLAAIDIRTHAGNDSVSGGMEPVSLAIWGGAGNDTLTGGAGNDTISGGAGTNAIDGGAGINTVTEWGSGLFTLTNPLLTDSTTTDQLANIQNAVLNGNPGPNTFLVTGWTGGGALAGSGSDTVVAVKNADFTLSNTALVASDGLALALSGVTKAQLTGGAGNNLFTLDGWTGTGTLAGGGGSDTVTATKNKNITLTNGSLMAGDGMSLTLVGIGTADLTGGPSNDTFTVSGWTGGGTIAGATVTLVAVKNVNFILTNTALTTSDGMALTLSGVFRAQLYGGAGNNTFSVSGWTGGGSLTGNGGTDTLVVTKDANITLSNSALQASDGLSISLTGIATANLTGGPSNNVFTVGGWSGNGTLSGGGGTDTVAATKDKNFTLSKTNLFGGDGMVLNLSGIAGANLRGGPSNDTFTVSSWYGTGSIIGGGGIATLVAIKNANFTLSNSSLATSDGMALSLAGVSVVKLTGGAGNNTFTVSGWTGSGLVTGGGGSDTIAATKNRNMTLANNSLVSGDGMSLVLAGIGTADLTGGPSNDTFTVSGWTGGGTLVGGGGQATVLASKNANFTLANAALTTTDGMVLMLSGIGIGRLFTGPANHTLDVTGWSGTGSLSGLGGTQTMRATKDFNFTISNSGLRAGDGLSMSLTGIATASLTGGPSANTFTVSGWTGSGTLVGGGGTDTVLAVKNADMILTNTALTTADGMAFTLSGMTKAQLYASSGNHTLDVTGWTGTGSLIGHGGTDTVVAAKSGNFVLSNAGVRDDGDGMALGLTGITAARLAIVGSAGFQISAAGFTGQTTLTGGSGNDTLIGGSGGNLILGGAGNDSLVGGTGRDLVIGGGGADTLTGRGNDLLISGTTSYDNNLTALEALLAEWASADSYATRIAKIKTGAVPGGFALNSTTVQDDLATNLLQDGIGSTGDWFVVNPRDTVKNQPGEEVDVF
jgi:parallel beta-helix repeat protein